MSLTSGTKLGPYEILAPLGAGGMGEVYKAKDTRLDRTVAIKVLPSHVASHPKVRQRFEREARAVSSLNHPHICTLYDIGSENGIDFMVMEHIEGQTLADRLKKGALPLDQALQRGIEIADALDKAHRQGVVHRDLKPGNMMLTKSGAKLLDFGLAKLMPEPSKVDPEMTTVTKMTREEAIVGTLQYMAPEQVEGKEADARTDIFAFGALLYEMVTGRKAFQGESQASLIAAILEHEPPAMSTLHAMTPPVLDHVVRTCLAKDPEKRWQSASDLTRELEWIAGTSSQAALALPVVGRPPTSGRLTILGTATLVIGALLGAIATWSVMRTEPQPVSRFSVNLSSVDRFTERSGGNLALSPDGDNLVYVGTRGEMDQLYLRPMDQLEGTPIKGTDGARSPFFSPNGEWVGFAVDGYKLMKVPLAGGAPRLICESCGADASWASDDTIVFEFPQGLMRVGADGGAPERLVTLDPAKGERQLWFPQILPGEKAVLFTVSFGAEDNSRIVVQSLETGERTDLVQGIEPHYVSTGHIVFAQGSSLLAVPFDVDRLRTTGAAIPVVEGVQMSTAGAQFAVSNNGTLVYKAGTGEAGDSAWMGELVWVDREGAERPLTENEGISSEPRLSPDGERLAVSKFTDVAAWDWDVWALELDRDSFTKLTFSGRNESVPIWTPDGKHVLFSSDTSGGWNVFSVPADGSGEPVQLTASEFSTTGCSWSPDGKALAVVQIRPDTGLDIGIFRVGGEGEPEILLGTPFVETQPTFSPDGRWLAYTSGESGQFEVYVRPFPGSGRKWKISTDGGSSPLWSPSGGELFYRQGDTVLAVPISTGSEFKPGIPVPLFEGRYRKAPLRETTCLLYDVARDGQQFVMLKPFEEQSEQRQFNVVLNWFEELKALAPSN